MENPYKALGEMVRVLTPDGEIDLILPNPHFYRRILKALNPDYEAMNSAHNPPSHNQAWDIIELRNLARQHGLKIVSSKPIDWYPDKKRPLKWFLELLLPEIMKRVEVRYILKKSIPNTTQENSK